jgi:hypothetical protein
MTTKNLQIYKFRNKSIIQKLTESLSLMIGEKIS